MTTAELTTKTRDILAEQLGLVPDDLADLSKTWADHGADSLDEVEIVMAFEEDLGVVIHDEDAVRLAQMSIAGVITWLETLLA